MCVVGNLVGQVAELSLQAGLGPVEKPLRHAPRFGSEQLFGGAARTVLQDSFAGLERQVEPVVQGIALFQRIDDTQALQVVLEAAGRGVGLSKAGVERVLPGVAERGMAQVVRQGNGLDQIFVQSQRAGDGAAELGDLQRVRQARAEQVAFVVQEHLGFVDQTPKRRAVNDAITVALEVVARRRRIFGMAPTPAQLWAACVGLEHASLPLNDLNFAIRSLGEPSHRERRVSPRAQVPRSARSESGRHATFCRGASVRGSGPRPRPGPARAARPVR